MKVAFFNGWAEAPHCARYRKFWWRFEHSEYMQAVTLTVCGLSFMFYEPAER